MNGFKKVDVYGQMVLLVGWLVAALLPFTRENAFVGYFIVGGWQFASAIIHYIQNNKLILVQDRYAYEKALIIVLVGIITLPIPDVNVIYLLLLLLLSPLMAIYYLYISIRECRIWHAKALVHLK